ncbi:hypothetical protein ACGFIK_22075 [Micromonospora sp. NPDC048871]|uniref:hypothetical protein n=1 Tax=unclassified Micromonospora TaxID=2617518 RepID=UPI002E1339D6|nr:hypothetical protein OIE53_20220 [Micromonospora sp. NBC_01739]
MISADGQEVINLRLVLSMAHTPMGAPLLVMLETYDTDPEARQPAGAFPLSIRQAGNLSRGITGLLRLARHTTWCDQLPGANAPLFTNLVQAQRGLSDEEIAQFLSTGRMPDLSESPEDDQ